ncbi:MAG: lipid II:glycine glycyltransferase FemX [Hyphomicrobiales bacterium]
MSSQDILDDIRMGPGITGRTGADRDHSGVELNVVHGSVWDRHAAAFCDVVQEHTGCFTSARWGAGRRETVTVSRHGEIIGGAVVVLFRVPGSERGLAIVKWGPLWRRPGTPADPRRFERIMRAIKREYVDRRGCFLSILPHADPDRGATTAGVLERLGFKPGAQLAHPDRYLVNMTIGADALRKSLDQKWRYNLKKAEKHDFTAEFADPCDGLGRFMALYEQMLDRKRFQDFSAISTLASLMRSRVEAHRPTIVLVHHEGTPTAGAVIDTSGERAVYLYGATDHRALPLKAGYVMHWWIAEWLTKQPRIRWYDLGGSDGDKGLHQFKKGFVGKAGKIIATPPARNLSADVVSTLIGRAIYVARDVKAVGAHALHGVRGRISA